MKKLRRKLRSKAGESILETLCAILIAALAIAALSGIVTTAAAMNRRVKSRGEALHAEIDLINKKETGTGKCTAGTANMVISGVGIDDCSYSVSTVTSPSGDLIVYSLGG